MLKPGPPAWSYPLQREGVGEWRVKTQAASRVDTRISWWKPGGVSHGVDVRKASPETLRLSCTVKP